MSKILKLDLSHARNVYAVGDIHGAFSKLEKKLNEIGFDPAHDYLLSVGDLIDRGPENERVLEFLDQPWFYAVQGNHEQILYTERSKERAKNGGKWFNKLYYKDYDLYKSIYQRLRTLPIAMEVTIPGDALIGIIHATVPGYDWSKLPEILDTYDGLGTALWDRYNVKDALRAKNMGGSIFVKGIDHVFYGHTPLTQSLTVGNQSWIDTGGCFDDGQFTVVRIQ